MLYHEVQESKLCAVHSVNTVLQGPFFSEFDLAALASDLDRTERQLMLGDFLPELSHNVSLDIQSDEEIELIVTLLFYRKLWKCGICKTIGSVSGKLTVSGTSLYSAPEPLSKFYLSAYLDSLKGFGWNIFLVRGNFTKECPVASSEASNGFGKMLSGSPNRPTLHQEHQRGTEQQQQQQLSDPYMQYDEDLKAAIAATLMESSPATTTSSSETQPGSSEKENKISEEKNE
ncbi:hypothetical protein SASPL_137907 [Salvia splendens]|uniref:ubiquitinyl hydrolase 1 n=1 Tax=Salvia splendens TaxID=180675 RepID=A0A8X8WUB3_SALSN|nr:hypothetical protein SASPL_137907 [Salvia splendens]